MPAPNSRSRCPARFDCLTTSAYVHRSSPNRKQTFTPRPAARLWSRKYSAMLNRSGNCVISFSQYTASKSRDPAKPTSHIFLSHIFLFMVFPTGKCGRGKYLSLSAISKMRDPFPLDHRIRIEQTFDLEQSHCRIL